MSMLMLDKFPNGNLGNKIREDYSQNKMRGMKNRRVLGLSRFLTGQQAFRKTQRGLDTEPRGELGRTRERLQDSAEPPPHTAEIHKDVTPQFQHRTLTPPLKTPACVCALKLTRGGLFLLTEELFVLVRGNMMRWEELTTEGHVRCAVTFACTFFWRSVFTSKTASTLK